MQSMLIKHTSYNVAHRERLLLLISPVQTRVWTCILFEHQLAVTCIDLTEHVQISLQVGATCYKLSRACDSFEWYNKCKLRSRYKHQEFQTSGVITKEKLA
jgi:abortive infection bacteriophage resistance protein